MFYQYIGYNLFSNLCFGDLLIVSKIFNETRNKTKKTIFLKTQMREHLIFIISYLKNKFIEFEFLFLCNSIITIWPKLID